MKTLFNTMAGWFLALLAMFAVLPAAAQAPSSPAPAAETDEKSAPARPALWKIADADTTIYLFGTIHVLPAGVDWFGGPVAEAFANSGSLITEVADEDPAAMQGLVVKVAMLPEGNSLREMLSAQERGAYEAALGSYSIPPALFDRFEPWYAAVALSTLPLMQAGFLPEHGVEDMLEKKAEARGISHTGLETSAYQLGLFDALPADVQKRYLGEVVEQLPTIRQDIGAMVEAWKRGDADALAKLMNAEESDPVMIETLLIARNRAWAQWIGERMDEPGTVFLAVGAGHLAGAGSVQEQLAAQGISTTRLQ